MELAVYLLGFNLLFVSFFQFVSIQMSDGVCAVIRRPFSLRPHPSSLMFMKHLPSLLQSSPYKALIMALHEIDRLLVTSISSPKPFLPPALVLHPAGSTPDKCFTTSNTNSFRKNVYFPDLQNHKPFSFLLENRGVFSQHCSDVSVFLTHLQNPAGAASSGFDLTQAGW